MNIVDDLPQDFEPSHNRMVLTNNLLLFDNSQDGQRSPIETDRSSSDFQMPEVKYDHKRHQ